VRDTFTALDCRDVARVDLRMTPDGKVYVIEINPLPGLTPEFSDLCMIAKVAGMDYRMLIGEILAGCIKRHREARSPQPASIGPRPAEPGPAPNPARESQPAIAAATLTPLPLPALPASPAVLLAKGTNGA
jgi:D-alanine-D-alanine ligase